MRAAPAMVSITSCFIFLMIILAFQLRITRGAYKPLMSNVFSDTRAAGDNTAADLPLMHPIRNFTESAPSYEVTVHKGRLGQYLARLYIGTPAVSFTAIVDTGSDLVWRQCKPCIACYPQTDGGASIFDAARSATYKTATCREPLCEAIGGRCSVSQSSPIKNCSYVISYTAGHTAGELSYDMLSMRRFGELRAPRVRLAFGCSHDSRAVLNFTGAGGILGLGGGQLSLPSQLGVGAFSYCLPTRRLVGTPLVLGPVGAVLEAAPAHVRGRMQSARMITGPHGESLGFVSLRVSVGGRRLWGSPRAAILDTGSPFMSLHGRAYAALLQAFRSRIPASPVPPFSLGGTDIRLDLCYRKRELLPLINSNASLIPSLTLHLGRARLRLPIRNYFVPIKGLMCLAVRQLDPHTPILIGNIQQQNYFFLHDLKSRSISVAATDCSNTSLRD